MVECNRDAVAFWCQALLKLYYKVDEFVEHTLGRNDLQQFFFWNVVGCCRVKQRGLLRLYFDKVCMEFPY